MDSSTADFISQKANRKVRKLLGRAYLRENRIGEALEVYLGILKDYPDDGDVFIVLGNLYRLAGSPATAEKLYRRALSGNYCGSLPENLLALQNMETEGSGPWQVEDELSETALTELVNRLQRKQSPAEVDEIRMAAEHLLARIMAEDRQGGEIVDREGTQLMPALIALNIRQARAAGFLDLAEALQSLQINLTWHADEHWADDLLKDEHRAE